MKIGGWLATHRTQALLGAGGAVAAFALYRSKKGGAGAAPGGGGMFGTSASAAVPTISGAYGPYSSGQLDQYNQLAGSISSANDAINAIQTQLAASAVGQLPASSGGQGLLSGTLGSGPGDFMLVSGPAENQALATSGIQQYQQLGPGLFAPVATTSSPPPGSAYGNEGLAAYAPATYVKRPA